MARTGKIARLDADTRDELNERLKDGQPAKEILEWLNAREDVKEALKCYFDGAPVNENNLSEWRRGGYQDWLRHDEVCNVICHLDHEAEILKTMGRDEAVSELLAVKVSAEFAQVTQALLAETTDPKERWKILKEILPHLSRMRRADRACEQ